MQGLIYLLICCHVRMQRLEAVPEYQLGAFMLEMARLINDTHFNGTHVVLGTKLAQQQLKAEVRSSLAPISPSGFHRC